MGTHDGAVRTMPIARCLQVELDEVARLLESAEDAEWRAPTACPPWEVRHLVAHMVIDQTFSLRRLLPLTLPPASIPVTARRAALRVGERKTRDQLLTSWQAVAWGERPGAVNRLMSVTEQFAEVAVHHADLREALPRGGSADPEVLAAAVAATVTLRRRVGFGGARMAEGLAFRATDADLRIGVGPEVRGGTHDLLLAVAGRPVADRLDGPGCAVLSRRLARPLVDA